MQSNKKLTEVKPQSEWRKRAIKNAIEADLLKHSNFYKWSIDLNRKTVNLPPYARAELGLSDDITITIDLFETLIFADDSNQFKQALLVLPDKATPVCTQYRMVNCKTGDIIWFNATLMGLFDSQGYASEIYGTHYNISSEKTTQESLKHDIMAKSQFVANISHEIRTPLSNILGIVALLEKIELNKEGQKYIGILERTGNALIRIVNDILDFSKIEFGEFELVEAPFNIRFCLDDVCALFAPNVTHKNIDIICNVDGETPDKIIGDEGRIRQILINIVGNAVKFTDKGSITIDVETKIETENCLLQISVTDTGEGIPEDKIKDVFEKFKQANNPARAQNQGAGLGLNITKELVTLMGGEIFVESELGLGSKFSVFLNLKRPMAASENSAVDIPKQDTSPTLILTEAIAASVNLPNTFVREVDLLVAEDNEANQMFMTYVLEELGVDFAIAVDGQDAVEKSEALNPKLILMDISMPCLDGLEATKKIRQNERDLGRPHTAIVALTANTVRGDREKCLEAGMDEYLSKPISINEIKDFLAEWLYGRPNDKRQIKSA